MAHIVRLKHLVAVLNKRRAEKAPFYMGAFFHDYTNPRKPWERDIDREQANGGNIPHNCQSSACALGYAGLDPLFKNQGLVTNIRCGTVGFCNPVTGMYGGADVEAGAAFFELTRGEAHYLFMPASGFRKAAAKILPGADRDSISAVIQRVKHVIKQHEAYNKLQ